MATASAYCPRFGLRELFDLTLLVAIPLAGWANASYLGLAIAGLAIFGVVMLQKLSGMHFLWLPGWNVREWLVVLCIYFMLVGLQVPATQSNCWRRRSPAPVAPAASSPPAIVPQATN